ncbi:hypothetical protein WJX81_001838 [Elliptochloris bilobata]|uniref:FAS1 domain-containing protein n=1 Tax=Elliptochloris bilobata TaxID=381761 RepID=A0AAW1SHJ3_9CHLO
MAKLVLALVTIFALLAAGSGRELLQSKTVTGTAAATPSLSILVEALTTANLTGTLDDPNLVATVFAPTNDAFAALLKQLNYTEAQLLSSYILKPTLLYHVVPGVAAKSMDLTNGQQLPTLLKGSNLTVALMMGGVNIEGAASNGTVTMPNIAADKAVVHVIDTVLLPASSVLDTYKPAPSTRR